MKRTGKRILAGICVLFLGITCSAGNMTDIQAAETAEAVEESDDYLCVMGRETSELEAEYTDSSSVYYDAQGDTGSDTAQTTGTFTSKGLDGITYTHDSKYQNTTIRNGIDISKWNGNMDWNTVKASGLDFVFIRLAYRTLSAGTINTDSLGMQNLAGAKAAGIPAGVYFFSQAVNEAEAREEADYILNMLDGQSLDLPIIFDLEMPADSRQEDANLSKAAMTALWTAFKDEVEKAGYKAMLYTSPYFVYAYLDPAVIEAEDGLWVARYNSVLHKDSDTFTWSDSYTVAFWQYSSKGYVNGIGSDICDLDFWYDDGSDLSSSASADWNTKIPDAEIKTNTELLYEVTSETLTMRSGPSTSYSQVTTLNKGAVLSVTDIQDDWAYGSTVDGYKGWVSLQYCQKIDTGSSETGTETKTGTTETKSSQTVSTEKTTSTEKSTQTSGTVYQVTASALNVRSGPGTSYSILGTLSKGTKVTITDQQGKWGKFNYNGKTGWISLDYCTKVTTSSTGSSQTASTQKTTSSSGTVYQVTASSLNVRSGPGTSYSKLGTLTKGTKITITGQQNKWGKFSYKGKTGWVSLSYCAKVKTSSTSTGSSQTASTQKTTSSKGTVYQVTASSLNVRSGPGTSYSKLGTLKKGTKVTVLSTTSSGWGKITYSGKTGYVKLSYCKKTS